MKDKRKPFTGNGDGLCCMAAAVPVSTLGAFILKTTEDHLPLGVAAMIILAMLGYPSVAYRDRHLIERMLALLDVCQAATEATRDERVAPTG